MNGAAEEKSPSKEEPASDAAKAKEPSKSKEAKKGRTPYAIFCDERQSSVKTANPGLKAAEVKKVRSCAHVFGPWCPFACRAPFFMPFHHASSEVVFLSLLFSSLSFFLFFFFFSFFLNTIFSFFPPCRF